MYAIITWCFPMYFLNVSLSESRCLLVLGLFSSHCNSFSMLFINSVFLLCSLRPHILFQNCFASFSSVCWNFFVHSTLLAGRIFFPCFRMSCFVYIVWFCVGIFIAFFLSPTLSDLFSQVVLFVLSFVLLFSFRQNLFQCFSSILSFLLHCISILIFHPGFEFLFVIFRGLPILKRTNLGYIQLFGLMTHQPLMVF